jgi:peptidylprolyl isomerase
MLESSDLIEGRGRPARKGDIVTVRWVETSYSRPGTVIATTWGNSPQAFEVGLRQVIRGFDLGILGMRQGGRRELIIPPALAFRSDITVVLVVDLVKIGGVPPLPKPLPPAPIRVAPMHGRFVLRSSVAPEMPAGVLWGPTPPITTTAAVRIALDDVIDPAPQSLVDAALPGARWVELTFTVRNLESSIIQDVDPPNNDALQFFVDVAGSAGTVPTEFLEQYFSLDMYTPSGSPSCARPTTIAARATATYCVGFELPVGVPVLNAGVSFGLPRALTGSAGEWRISENPTAWTPTPQTLPAPSSSIAHLGGTLIMTDLPSWGTPGFQTAILRLTLDQVDDPAPAPPLGSMRKGERIVGLRVTLSNTGNLVVPCYEGDPDELTIEWDVDTDAAPVRSGYIGVGLPAGLCDDMAHDPGLVPGASATGDILLSIPDGIPVANVVVSMGIGGFGEGPAVEWLVP